MGELLHNHPYVVATAVFILAARLLELSARSMVNREDRYNWRLHAMKHEQAQERSER